ncbi:MAG TPA: hypothetical protein VGG35_23740 [Streptosporangiaceae bacterium]|jgi:hypothetical protein
MSDDSLEIPDADAAEQETEAVSDADDQDLEEPAVPLEADPADAAEQAREVPGDEDEDYR